METPVRQPLILWKRAAGLLLRKSRMAHQGCLFTVYSLSCTICFQLYYSLSVIPFACFCLYVQPIWPVQLGTSGYGWECHEDWQNCQSWPRFKSLYSGLADTRKIAQYCKATMFGHGRICFLLILPRRNLFLMGTVLHLLRSCIAGRGLWGKPFNGEIIPDGNTLVAALNSLKVRCSRVITASKPDGAPGITCPLHKLLPKKIH